MKYILALLLIPSIALAQQSLIREPSGNVVLRSDNIALRFFSNHGGTPLEWWIDGWPLLTNSFPGSGVSVGWNSGGQDPTQATANGILEYPVNGDSYYIKESIVDPIGVYEVRGFAPDFWLSAEARDDAAPMPQWDTIYRPGCSVNSVSSAANPVVFPGSIFAPLGMFFVGNELTDPDLQWATRLRKYPEGRIAAKVQMSLGQSAPDSFGGIVFRKQILESTKEVWEAYTAPGYSLLINRAGVWNVWKNSTLLLAGNLTTQQKARLLSHGLTLEIRTHNDYPGYVGVYFDSVFVGSINDASPVLGESFGLLAFTSSGYISFANRQVFDVGTEFISRYTALPNATIQSDITIRRMPGVFPAVFRRSAHPGVMLNKQTFPLGNRSCVLYPKNGPVMFFEGIYPTLDIEKVSCGSNVTRQGLTAYPLLSELDGVSTGLLHVQTNGVNEEFPITFSPLAYESDTEARELHVRVNWKAYE